MLSRKWNSKRMQHTKQVMITSNKYKTFFFSSTFLLRSMFHLAFSTYNIYISFHYYLVSPCRFNSFIFYCYHHLFFGVVFGWLCRVGSWAAFSILFNIQFQWSQLIAGPRTTYQRHEIYCFGFILVWILNFIIFSFSLSFSLNRSVFST